VVERYIQRQLVCPASGISNRQVDSFFQKEKQTETSTCTTYVSRPYQVARFIQSVINQTNWDMLQMVNEY